MISDGAIGSGMFLWVLMITSDSNRQRPGDVPLGAGYAVAGLPAPSKVRTLKVATIEAAMAQPIGAVSPDILAAVRAELGSILGLPVP